MPSGRQAGARRAGFTLIELMIVLTVISIIVSIAVPLYQKSIIRAKESVLRNNLFTLRTVKSVEGQLTARPLLAAVPADAAGAERARRGSI